MDLDKHIVTEMCSDPSVLQTGELGKPFIIVLRLRLEYDVVQKGHREGFPALLCSGSNLSESFL